RSPYTTQTTNVTAPKTPRLQVTTFQLSGCMARPLSADSVLVPAATRALVFVVIAVTAKAAVATEVEEMAAEHEQRDQDEEPVVLEEFAHRGRSGSSASLTFTALSFPARRS